MENTVTLSLEKYHKLIKCEEFFERFASENLVFVGCTMNFNGAINDRIMTTSDIIKKMSYNLQESEKSNRRLMKKYMKLKNKKR